MPNLLITCSGPGTRSTGYTKFHKALIRVGNCAVIDHIINSYTDIGTIYITLGFEGDLIKEYIKHAQYTNVEFIEIKDWMSNQIKSFQQIPEHVFDEPFYYNACDNWTTVVPKPNGNTYYTCNPQLESHYDSDGDSVYSGIAYIEDSQQYYQILQSATITRNDLLLYQQLDSLNSVLLDNWYDVGNEQSYKQTLLHHNDSFNVLDKTHQEVYTTNNRVIKLFEDKPDIDFDSVSFPHPSPVEHSDNALSYEFVDGVVNPTDTSYKVLLDSLCQLWNFSIANNHSTYNTKLWQDKTWSRFNQLIQQHPEFGDTIILNGKTLDPTRIIENLPWPKIISGIQGPTHGDLVLDNIVVGEGKVTYIDHRQGRVDDIYYDVCKFYHSLHLHNINLKSAWSLTQNDNEYTINLSLSELDKQRIKQFHLTELYTHAQEKIELCVGCIWLSMSPLNVDQELNKFLFLLSMEKLNELL